MSIMEERGFMFNIIPIDSNGLEIEAGTLSKHNFKLTMSKLDDILIFQLPFSVYNEDETPEQKEAILKISLRILQLNKEGFFGKNKKILLLPDDVNMLKMKIVNETYLRRKKEEAEEESRLRHEENEDDEMIQETIIIDEEEARFNH